MSYITVCKSWIQLSKCQLCQLCHFLLCLCKYVAVRLLWDFRLGWLVSMATSTPVCCCPCRGSRCPARVQAEVICKSHYCMSVRSWLKVKLGLFAFSCFCLLTNLIISSSQYFPDQSLCSFHSFASKPLVHEPSILTQNLNPVASLLLHLHFGPFPVTAHRGFSLYNLS